MDKLYNWPFLSEPIWRWFMFLIIICSLMAVWHGVLRHMRG